MCRGFADDLDATNNGVLLLSIRSKCQFRRAGDVGADESSCLEDIRRRPSCSASIDADSRPEDVLAGVSVRRALQR